MNLGPRAIFVGARADLAELGVGETDDEVDFRSLDFWNASKSVCDYTYLHAVPVCSIVADSAKSAFVAHHALVANRGQGVFWISIRKKTPYVQCHSFAQHLRIMDRVCVFTGIMRVC